MWIATSTIEGWSLAALLNTALGSGVELVGLMHLSHWFLVEVVEWKHKMHATWLELRTPSTKNSSAAAHDNQLKNCETNTAADIPQQKPQPYTTTTHSSSNLIRRDSSNVATVLWINTLDGSHRPGAYMPIATSGSSPEAQPNQSAKTTCTRKSLSSYDFE